MAKQVSSRLLLNSLLIIIVAVLVYFIWYQPVKIQKDSALKPLFSMAAYQAVSIQIQRPNKEDVLLNKENEKWVLLEPGIAPVNAERVKHLLTILQEPVIATYDPTGKDLSKFGLAPGKIKLTIASADRTEEATFGLTNAVTLNRYILKNNSIFTINEIIYGVLGSSVTQLLSHYLLPDYIEIVDVDAPKLLAETPRSFWYHVEAKDIADYNGDETIIGKIKLSIKKKAVAGVAKDRQAVLAEIADNRIEFNILSINPFLVLGRADLKVKYTFGEHALSP